MENRDVMEEFAVIGLDTQEKKAEAEAILKELGYWSGEDWNKKYRSDIWCQFIITLNNGSYAYHNHDGDEPHITLDQLREKVHRNKIGDVVVKVLSEEHGKEVIQAFKDLGVDPKGCSGTVNGCYYGLFDGGFTLYNTPRNSKVITLEELKAMNGCKPKYPCMMEVWDNEGEFKREREVIADFINPDNEKMYVALDKSGRITVRWQHARLIQPDPLKEVIAAIKQQTDRIEKVKNTEESGLIANYGIFLKTEEAQLILDALEKNEK